MSTGTLLGGESLEDEARNETPDFLSLLHLGRRGYELTWWERSASIRIIKLPVACFTPWMYAVPATTQDNERCTAGERLELTQLSLTYLIQALLLLDVVPNGERGRGGGGGRGRKRGERRKKEVEEKRMKRVEGDRRGEEEEKTRC